MSLWGATVITNLISAIPWIGQDIVESIKITILAVSVIFLYSILPTIGNVHINALKKMNKLLDKKDYISIPTSFLAFLVGLIDGDGYIQITKTTKGFITIKLIISLHSEDISTLEYIHSVLKLGKINIYKDLRSPTCKLVINKTELQEILFPLLIHNNIFFLTETRINQFNLAMHILRKDIKLFEEIPSRDNIEDVFKLPENANGYTLLHFFKNWIGFTCSEGSFFIKSNNDGCFQLKQRIHTNLFEAFKLVFHTTRKIDTTNNFNQFGVSSKSDIQTIINFFSFEGLHPRAPGPGSSNRRKFVAPGTLIFKDWLIGYLCPSLYPGVVQFVKDNPLTYKRVKREFRKIFSRKEDFHFFKQTLKQQEKVKRENVRREKVRGEKG